MDKYEYKVKLDQMKSLAAENRYKEALEIADTVNWSKIKNVNALIKAGEIYEKNGRYEDSRDILLMAQEHSPIGRMIIYRLAEVAVRLGNYAEAKDYYEEFVELAPHDNLKYVLKYEISKAEGADVQSLIHILEDLKEQEYSEEWACELAYLYHEAGMGEKCVETCDELILWFGDGPYVERALELKMLYRPLTPQQEEKYRAFRQGKSGVVELAPGEETGSGEIIREPVQIPKVKLSPERFNTQNIQKELQKSLQEIMEATEKEAVDDSMANVEKLVENFPYLQMPEEETVSPDGEELPYIETDEEIDNSLQNDYMQLLAEDYDGQMSLYVPDQGQPEPQIAGQISIGDVLADWEKKKRAAKAVLDEAEQRKLRASKERALREVAGIMENLLKLDPELNSEVLLPEDYDGRESGEQDMAQTLATMTQALDQRINTVKQENAEIDEQLAVMGAGLVSELPHLLEEPEPAGETAEPPVMPEAETDSVQSGLAGAREYSGDRDGGMQELVPDEGDEAADDLQIAEETDSVLMPVDTVQPEEILPADTLALTEAFERAVEEQALAGETQADEMDFEEALLAEATRSVQKEVSESLAGDGGETELPKIAEPEEEGHRAVKRLSKEQREIFSYFVPIKGMERQLCQALTGAAGRLAAGGKASTGNMIIQGGPGSGKTVLATSMIKALQQETGKPDGRVGRIEASVLNQKDIASLLKKVAGGCLIIEQAGGISRETAIKLSTLLECDETGLFVIMEDTHKGIEKALSRDAGFASRFSEKINIPIFTSDELVSFAKSYANEQGYTIDEMGVLALYNSISNIQKLDQATTLTEVKEIVDEAIVRAERGGLKKAFSIIASRRYDDEDYVILHEKDFAFKI